MHISGTILSILSFRHGPGAAQVIQAALSKALVPYYPLAGRLTEPVLGQLQVKFCAGGVLFIESTSGCILMEVDYIQDIEKYEDPDGREHLVQTQVTQFAEVGTTRILPGGLWVGSSGPYRPNASLECYIRLLPLSGCYHFLRKAFA
ncbi:hypothetical protein CDL15_Pgr023139 [Punica granatum]|uniref:Uncharacterized protein n=1 Tax=Punica granatum TaxID=22663 RepID=A0A218X409_PUNGR|nr:hypothetical protein CDL15_Pgr023139 [Punica granatum]PKI68647.1 hypothetical protein CRG98_010927 [Punica granatum]